MSDFTKEQENIIEAKVEHQVEDDKLREDIKERVNAMFFAIADFAENNWEEFSKNPKTVFRAKALDFMKKNGGLFRESLDEGLEYINVIARNIDET